MPSLSSFNLVVIVAYLVGIVGIGCYAGLKARHEKGAGRLPRRPACPVDSSSMSVAATAGWSVRSRRALTSSCPMIHGPRVRTSHGGSPQGRLADTEVEVTLDGVRHCVKAGHTFRLKPGESITLTPFLWHEFWAEAGTGISIVGEVSSVNDDEIDNVFLSPAGRFPVIEED